MAPCKKNPNWNVISLVENARLDLILTNIVKCQNFFGYCKNVTNPVTWQFYNGTWIFLCMSIIMSFLINYRCFIKNEIMHYI